MGQKEVYLGHTFGVSRAWYLNWLSSGEDLMVNDGWQWCDPMLEQMVTSWARKWRKLGRTELRPVKQPFRNSYQRVP